MRCLAGNDSNGNSDRIEVSHAAFIPLSLERYLLTAERGAVLKQAFGNFFNNSAHQNSTALGRR